MDDILNWAKSLFKDYNFKSDFTLAEGKNVIKRDTDDIGHVENITLSGIAKDGKVTIMIHVSLEKEPLTFDQFFERYAF